MMSLLLSFVFGVISANIDNPTGYNFSICHWTTVIKDPSRRHHIPLTTHYPCSIEDRDNEYYDMTFPLMVFGHASHCSNTWYDYIWKSVVPWGYIVAMPLSYVIEDSHKLVASDMAYLLEYFYDDCNRTASCPLFGKIKNRSMVSGHSMGGAAALLIAGNDINVEETFKYQYSAMMTLSGCGVDSKDTNYTEAASRITIPSMLLSGSSDCMCYPPYNESIEGYFQRNIPSTTCKYLGIINHATHCHFQESGTLEDDVCVVLEDRDCTGSVPQRISKEKQWDIVISYYALFMYQTLYAEDSTESIGWIKDKLQKDQTDGVMDVIGFHRFSSEHTVYAMLSCLRGRNRRNARGSDTKTTESTSPMVQSSDAISTMDHVAPTKTVHTLSTIPTNHYVDDEKDGNFQLNEDVTLELGDSESNRSDPECKSNDDDDRRTGIFPDPDHIETTLAKSQRTQESINHVVHDVNWSGIFDEKLVPNLTKWEFRPKSSKKVERGTDAWTIEILSPSQCDKLIALCELYGFADTGFPPRYRSNTRMITNDSAFAELLYERIKMCCPAQYKVDGTVWKICGLNERFRWCKYVKGQRFRMHVDARFTRNERQKSFYTVNVYLNDSTDFEGGKTRFYRQQKSGRYKITKGVSASAGMALMFNQYPDSIQHDGEEVGDIKVRPKYLLRTDVMYEC